MRTIWYKHICILLALLVVGGAVASYRTGLKYANAHLDVHRAKSAVREFHRYQRVAQISEPDVAAEALYYALHLYRTLRWNAPELGLDDFVEEQRAYVLRAIMDVLREKTGKDLGNDPKIWVKEYLPSVPPDRGM